MPSHIRDIPTEIFNIGDISREICNTGHLFLCSRPFERDGSWTLYGLSGSFALSRDFTEWSEVAPGLRHHLPEQCNLACLWEPVDDGADRVVS